VPIAIAKLEATPRGDEEAAHIQPNKKYQGAKQNRMQLKN
jgi:hypothetical protein